MQQTAAIYIHVPFCKSKCRYGSFVSASSYAPETMDVYLQRVKEELTQQAEPFSADRIESIFFGGGTPSLLPRRAIPALLSVIREKYTLLADCEVTCEANPDSFDLDLARSWADAGVNRVSLGCQAVQATLLTLLGRPHTAEQARSAIRIARQAGIERVNLDLIYGIPTQTLGQWEESLRFLLEEGVQHVSSYALSLEKGTPLYADVQAGKLAMPDEDFMADCYERIEPMVRPYGLTPYEISNFAVPGQACRHNLVYWRNGVYLGCGPAAHGANDLHGWQRTRNTDSMEVYLKSGPMTQTEQIPLEEEMFETVMLGTRLRQGVDLAAFERRFGISLSQAYPKAVPACLARGWAVIGRGYFALTPQVWYLQNAVLQLFMERQ